MSDDSIIPPLPDFLRREAGDRPRARPSARRRRRRFKMTPAMKAAAATAAEKRAKVAARPIVREALEAGAETFGQLRKATGLPDDRIRAALRFYRRNRVLGITGRRYRLIRKRG